jgi:excisionase family DNA binding protein
MRQQQAEALHFTDETLPERPKAVEIAAWLRLSANTIRGWARTGQIPCKRAGRTYIFDKTELLKWVRPEQEAA